MLATDTASEPHPPHLPHAAHLEAWSQNERMRHIPSMSAIIDKLEHDIRRRVDHLYHSFAGLDHHDPHRTRLEGEFRSLCKWIDRVGDIARRPRGHQHPPNDLGSRIGWSFSHAVQSLHGADNETFGRRLPFQTHERSNAEPLRAALLAVIQHVQRLQELIREIDPRIDERLYEGLVQLREPLPTEPFA
ncbi:MAG TPA: hypothetical protein VGF48_06690 [Thermoanaerobaculia bacterium]|jgi:hypothetical protein